MFRPREGWGKFHYYECKAVPEGNHSESGRERWGGGRCCVAGNKMQDEMWQIAVGDDSETNHQHCFYETSVTLGILTASPPSGSRLTLVGLKDRSQQYGQPLSFRHVGLRMCRSRLVLFCFFSSSRNRTNLDPWDQYSDAQIWEALEKTHIKEMVSVWNSASSDHASLSACSPLPLPHCPHICVSPPAGEPAASLAAVGGDGERRELLRGGAAASLRGPGPAAQQQGANCGSALVRLVDGKRSVTPVRHFPRF